MWRCALEQFPGPGRVHVDNENAARLFCLVWGPIHGHGVRVKDGLDWTRLIRSWRRDVVRFFFHDDLAPNAKGRGVLLDEPSRHFRILVPLVQPSRFGPHVPQYSAGVRKAWDGVVVATRVEQHAWSNTRGATRVRAFSLPRWSKYPTYPHGLASPARYCGQSNRRRCDSGRFGTEIRPSRTKA
jgi:hypothetical protein